MKPTKQSLSQLRKRAFLTLLLASLAAVAAPLGGVGGWFSASAATTFTVNSTGDGGDANLGDGLCNDGAGNCTLRAAIQQANALGGADTIQFSVTGTINLTGPLPDLSTDMTITGPGSGLLTVRRDTGGDYRVLTVGIPNTSGVTVSISGLTVTNGKTRDGANSNVGSADNGQVGGGVLNYSTLTMTDVAVTGNRTGAGGSSPVFGGEGGDGGGIFNAGTLTLTNCSVNGNFTGNGGEGNNGGGNGGDGGGILNANLLTMTGGTVSNNTTGTAGPTVGIGRTGGRGGGIFSAAVVNLTGVSVSNNTTGGGSPGANAFGGHGGGLYLDGGSATMTNCIVSGNTTGLSPAGTNGYGGGIENSAALVIRNSTISGNTGNAAGAILNRLALNMVNSTVSGNLLNGSGAAIASSDSFSSLRLTNSTIAFNAGQGLHGNTGSGFIRNTIIARNAGGVGHDAFGTFNSQGNNIVGVADGSEGFTAAGDQTGTSAAPLDPKLGPLASNGGPTLTHALLAGSPALDAGNNALALDPSGSALTTDQRGPGFPRVVDSEDAGTVATVDIGAYEKQGSDGAVNNPPTFTKGPDQTVAEDSGPQTVTGWATGISAGAGDTGQTVTFIVTGNTNPGLFSAGPAVSPDGTLTYTPAPDANGSATITIILKDDGGTANGGQDTSAPQSFVITVTPVDDPAGGSFEFAQASFSVAEGGGGITILVRRTGVTTGAASVGYLTDDGADNSTSTPCSSTGGMALSRCDFTLAVGRLDFAAGETEKTFEVLITDDSYIEGTESLTLRLEAPAGGAALGSQATATLQITDDAQESSGNPIDNSEDFVRQHYHDFLNRQPDAGGLAFWVNGIESCGADQQCRQVKRTDTSAAFFLSIEFQETGYLVYRTYKAAFGNLPSAPVPVRLREFLADTRQIGEGVIVGTPGWPEKLEANKDAYMLEFVQRPEFLAAYPSTMTPAQFVDALNANAGGALSQEERDQQVAALSADNTAQGRADVLRAVAEDEQLRQAEFNKAFVLMQYFGYLRRNPNDAPDTGFGGYNFWLGKLEEFGGDWRRAEMVRAFIESIEYRRRFAP
ncbi:MAG TPA: choice-of-anchor Q domain-containing protein [Pyrinomonadaceae bacterium]|nr:choice-of-anchor Q domain-containing protein [Pyrinomonadaceae bacterium]